MLRESSRARCDRGGGRMTLGRTVLPLAKPASRGRLLASEMDNMSLSLVRGGVTPRDQSGMGAHRGCC